jgi:hypothetical protein
VGKNLIVDKKLPRYEEPYIVEEILKNNVYKAKSEVGKIISVHASRLVMFRPRFAPSVSGGIVK